MKSEWFEALYKDVFGTIPTNLTKPEREAAANKALKMMGTKTAHYKLFKAYYQKGMGYEDCAKLVEYNGSDPVKAFADAHARGLTKLSQPPIVDYLMHGAELEIVKTPAMDTPLYQTILLPDLRSKLKDSNITTYGDLLKHSWMYFMYVKDFTSNECEWLIEWVQENGHNLAVTAPWDLCIYYAAFKSEYCYPVWMSEAERQAAVVAALASMDSENRVSFKFMSGDPTDSTEFCKKYGISKIECDIRIMELWKQFPQFDVMAKLLFGPNADVNTKWFENLCGIEGDLLLSGVGLQEETLRLCNDWGFRVVRDVASRTVSGVQSVLSYLGEKGSSASIVDLATSLKAYSNMVNRQQSGSPNDKTHAEIANGKSSYFSK